MNTPLDESNNEMTSTEKNNAQTEANNEKHFKDWMQNIAKKNNGEPYSTGSSTQYAFHLKSVAEKFREALSPHFSIFSISDIDSFNDINAKIRKNKTFEDINSEKHNQFSSALDRYRDFLTYLNTSDKNMNMNREATLPSNHEQFSRNCIYFGAPGTGKSYTLNEQKFSLLKNGGEYERVTFHPDYSYAHFVGTYKPVPGKDSDGKDTITYSYVPGPFLRTYVKARNNPHTPVLLVIEEINRANVAAVFGDVFQLLDRDKNGVSEYPIHASEDIKKYLEGNLDKKYHEGKDYEEIRIPANMYIWATMNSADQGVFPMDTAFKRRWDFIYRGIDEGDNAEAFETKITLGKDDCERTIKWNDLRKAINRKLLEYNVNEDKLMGPYFIQPDISSDEFIRVFKNKVIMYLFEDAARQKRIDLFSGCGDEAKLYSGICGKVEGKGVFIFCDSISSQFKERMEEAE